MLEYSLITGKQYHHSDFSLDEIAAFVSANIIPFANSQTQLSAHYLVKLIESHAINKTSSYRTLVSEVVLNNPLISQLLTELINYQSSEYQKKAQQGHYYCDTIGDKRLSFRVYSEKSNQKSVALFSLKNNNDDISFSSASKYRH